MTDHTDPDGFDLVSLLIENDDLRAQLADSVAEADYLRAELERRIAAQAVGSGRRR